MDDLKSSPAYLEHCVRSFLKALHEAETLANAGKVGPELSDVLRHAADLLEIIEEGLEGREGQEGQAGASGLRETVEKLRGMLRAARSRVGGSGTLH